jgi:hypothetical protein
MWESNRVDTPLMLMISITEVLSLPPVLISDRPESSHYSSPCIHSLRILLDPPCHVWKCTSWTRTVISNKEQVCGGPR